VAPLLVVTPASVLQRGANLHRPARRIRHRLVLGRKEILGAEQTLFVGNEHLRLQAVNQVVQLLAFELRRIT
jgi:hypothetical protein